MVWVVCGFIQQDRAVERSVYKLERKKEGRIYETGVDNAFRFLTLGPGACAWLPLHALEHTPFLECSRVGGAAFGTAHVCARACGRIRCQVGKARWKVCRRGAVMVLTRVKRAKGL